MSFVTLVLFVFLAVISTMSAAEVSKPMRFSVFWPCFGNASFCAPRILAEGTIEQDSHRKFTAFLSAKKTNRYDLPPKPTVCLNSPGGDLSGAIELGRTIRKLQLDTCLAPEYSRVIEDDSFAERVFVKNVLCASACTFAFAGGVNREIDEGSRIGIHQFFDARKPVGDSATQPTIVVLATYLEEMGVRRNLLDIASVIPPNKLYWLNKTELQLSKIDNMATELAEWKLDTTEEGTASYSQSAPKCGDKEVTDAVTQIAEREADKKLAGVTLFFTEIYGREGANELKAATAFSYEVQAIRTRDSNEKTGAQQCAAELKMKSSTGDVRELPITYTVERTDDGKQIYVSVFGLK